ncbi:MAG: gamma carbonic anhydrase family protein [Promethearchaeota archaeon]
MIIKSPYNGTIPKIHPTAFIAPDVVIIGDVEIGAYANIWFGAKLRGDWGKIVIGEKTSIQENVVLHTTPGEICKIGNNVRLAHSCMCHGPCTIGDSSLVGIHATVLQGARLAKGCILGAGSILRGETKEHCLYAGIPATKKKRYPDPKEASLEANLYVENGQKFKKAGLGQEIPNEYLFID